jgi:hypothetical protein
MMAHIRPILEAMEKQDRDNYEKGQLSKKHNKNPYCERSHIRQFAAWSAGHFDEWGRV